MEIEISEIKNFRNERTGTNVFFSSVTITDEKNEKAIEFITNGLSKLEFEVECCTSSDSLHNSYVKYDRYDPIQKQVMPTQIFNGCSAVALKPGPDLGAFAKKWYLEQLRFYYKNFPRNKNI